MDTEEKDMEETEHGPGFKLAVKIAIWARHVLEATLAVFIALRVLGIIHWSWWWVTAPLWAPLVAIGIAFACCWTMDKWIEHKRKALLHQMRVFDAISTQIENGKEEYYRLLSEGKICKHGMDINKECYICKKMKEELENGSKTGSEQEAE
jgi:hypothetical protein